MLKKKMSKAVIYCRVAKKHQNREGELAFQRNMIGKFADLQGLDCVDSFEEIGKAGVVLYWVSKFCERHSDIKYLVVYDYTCISVIPRRVETYIFLFKLLGIEVIRVSACPLETSIRNINKPLLDSLVGWQEDGWKRECENIEATSL
jgi:DNA invertase Pin-like site-specific DNA recombinase